MSPLPFREIKEKIAFRHLTERQKEFSPPRSYERVPVVQEEVKRASPSPPYNREVNRSAQYNQIYLLEQTQSGE